MPLPSNIVVWVEECERLLEAERVGVCRRLRSPTSSRTELLSSRLLVPSPVDTMNARVCYRSMEVAVDLLKHLES